MNIGILGTGSVGEAIGTALANKGFSVKMGSRSELNIKAQAWMKKTGFNTSVGTFNDAAAFGDLLFLCLNGAFALEAIKSIDTKNTVGKIIVDLTNPLDFSDGALPKILDEYRIISLGEKIQEAIPLAHIVKTLNTVNYKLMIDARVVNDADHHLFMCGNDINSKNTVKHFLVDHFHWKPNHFVDLGDIKNARCVEAIVPFWVSVWKALETPLFNFKIVR